jgi:mannose-6-phosphate isomerase-like protein (cupin superfamily)
MVLLEASSAWLRVRSDELDSMASESATNALWSRKEPGCYEPGRSDATLTCLAPEGRESGLRPFCRVERIVAEGWKSVRIDDVEPIPVVGGTLLWRPLRRTLDIGAFGINAYVAPNAGDDVVEEHTEKTYGHEELYVVLAGRATFTLDGETLAAPAGTVVFIRNPEVKRHARADEPGTTVLAVGGPRHAAYAPSAWEHSFAAEKHRASGDYDAMVAEIAAGLEENPDNASLLYDLGCAEALAGRTDDALAHVSRALELKPDWADHARQDTDLTEVRKLPGWPLS